MRRSILAALAIAAAILVGAASSASAAFTNIGAPVNAVEGNGFSGVVAHFAALPAGGVPDPNQPPTIVWGDGQTSTGTVNQVGTDVYDVAGSHTYPEEGRFPFTVTLHTSEGNPTANGIANVADAPLTITGVPVDVVRGTPLTNQRVATFTDADPAGTAADYTATIDWGDGNTTPGSVVANNPGGGFAVTGNHSYTNAATYGVAITVHDVGGATATAFTTVAVSLPGGNLAFASSRSGKSQVWTMHADGSAQTQLTSNNSGEFFSPSWAPDGSRLAAGATVLGFQRPVAAASLVLPPTRILTVQEPGVWVLNPDGSGLSRLAVVRTPSQATPAWSRDTRRIAYVDGTAPDIFAVPTGSVAFPTMLTQTKRSTGPDYSPKGDRIAYSFKPGGLGQIWTMDPDGHHQAPLFTDGRSNTSPTYSPDLTRLAYVGTAPGDVAHIYVASPFGFNPRLLTPTVGIDPSWSPDGTKIAFTALSSAGRGQIHVINADGTGERALTRTGDNRHPTWRRNTCTNIRFCLGTVVVCAACPVLATYSLRAPAFHVGRRPTAVTARKTVPTGTAFRYTLSKASRVQIAISRIRTGHRVGRRCKLGKAPRGALRCLFPTHVGTLRRRGHKGANTTAFSGRLGRRALALGHYQAAIVAIDAKGRRSVARLLDFDVV